MSEQKMVKLQIDGQDVVVPDGTLVVEAAKLLGTQIPVYCYHPKMDPAGLCRICLVEIEKTPKLQIACATRVTEGMVVHTMSPKVAEARRGVLEFLLLNHPLDCPICDKGGECDLQDFTMEYGPASSRLTEPKLHKPKRVDLGPTIVLDEERCILCRRCTRFDDEIAQERNLVVVERGHGSLIGTVDGGDYESYFSGNTTEICPVGALTSKAYRFRARPWDLGHADSVCTQCSVGCNYRIDTRFGRIMRTFTRENPEVDGGWICDRGRYTFNYLYEPARLRRPLVRRDGDLEEATFAEAVALAAEKLQTAAAAGRVGVIGGGRQSDEEAFALQRFAREVLRTDNIDHRARLQKFASPARFGARIADIDDASLILVFGAITPEQAPILDLRIRRAVARGKARLVFVGPFKPEFAVPFEHVEYAAGAIGDLMESLADAVTRGSQTGNQFVDQLAQTFTQASKIVAVHNGRNTVAAGALERLMETLAGKDHQVGILVVGSQGNARGAEAAGCVPNLGPGYAPVSKPGMTTGEMLEAAASGKLDALYIAGANPALTYPDGALVRKALENVPFLVVADQLLTQTAAHADVVFAAASFAEKRGHVTNLEGRRQAFAQAIESPVHVATDAAILAAIAAALGKPDALSSDPDWLFARLEAAEQAAGTEEPLARPKLDQLASPQVDTMDAQRKTFTVIPVPKLYGGGSAAAHDPGLAPMRPQPCAIFHEDDALLLGIADGRAVTLAGRGGSITVAARIDSRAPVGGVLVIADMPEAPVNVLLDASGAGRVTVTPAAAREEATA
ncbi:MAG TPA: NADH-quinone oxidoreductase subunit NuoG [Candidatus Eremiobacteraceae bacterium]|nr:NADH-quinone oxidoreductase subunit NuoG [Candidatus Eremiobacteraceae bacterium]